ncbi:carboxypeptidase regulatory-like domain-containing protein [Myxococcus llanfairpwllgwyngyllgogerychwyrndrobwllllantysiliogogogochensis]|uniref:Carboxypeptidase regulatory-like domain-containing protein n=1 Tax=Myxococcus llanfairpwllgwyngyllgogerychwyrndrobwllllantysiliogogogochensis TaxID=2590453 RepID=A0A540X7N8_9BACT|nr:carboxypeptidase-like regulatory domain-containing protein [Myxococcus llanfairpwllgwyngyllgogerychwyrndrobwllllantysiliogogogochensis]TQF17257.1 carboxypeptidase regulatory-like domain-containing protein [Myxococcus llanfairpwllgwyngyllgogerychwyrndrobwllllantysiliogogogochensis]
MNLRRLCSIFVVPALLATGCGALEDSKAVGDETREANADLATSAVFSGTVRNSAGAVQAGVTVVINGISRTTDTTGRYFMSVVASANGYVLTLRKNGLASATEFYSASKTSLNHTLETGFVQTVSPTVDSTVTTPSGVKVNLKANTLVNASGVPATGPVSITVASYDPMRMPGDFTAVNSSGQQVALESVGAVFVGATDASGAALNLATGATATGFIPVPTQVGNMPACVSDGTCRLAMWKFNETTGKWEEKSANMQFGPTGTTFTMQGTSSISGAVPISTGGLGMWNADIEKREPACTIIELVGFPETCFGTTGTVQFSLKLPNAAGTLMPRTDTMSQASPFIVLYNIRANALQEVGITFPAGAPTNCAKNLDISSTPAASAGYPLYTTAGGVTRFNSGAPWGGTGYPKDPIGNMIDFDDVAQGTHPCKSRVQFTTEL